MRKRHLFAALVGALAVQVATAIPAFSHGYISGPPSRAAYCAAGTVTGCGDIQWEPQSVEGPKGFPSGGPADGKLCAGGNSRFAQLDNPRNGAWPTTKVAAGQKQNFTWKFTARHATAQYRYFLTKPGYSASSVLSRSNLNLTPLLTVPGNNAQPPSTLTHSVPLPAGLTGHHVLLAVWDVADTTNAFYSCVDLQF
ncbi:chitin-binding protein [Kitasatospora gansuensis]|uniref:Chitin-binding protein n=1 Tax=Kitasatospora gansuensis TaxID=258050 RepID=A0A7W7WI31_9ACTN|nr:lytic polysaccharide monooxygenase [Kitasatospora gansuensis]MBB4948402.1 chitin-binding protein [Kitasatospora gansuensis]